jgi:hypothetical protein
MLGVTAVTNVITMIVVPYIAFGTPNVYVRDGAIDVFNGRSGGLHINDNEAVRVQIVK